MVANRVANVEARKGKDDGERDAGEQQISGPLL